MNANLWKTATGAALATAALLSSSGLAAANPGVGSPNPAPRPTASKTAAANVNPVAWGVNVLFGGSYGGGGKPIGSDQGTWWYAAACAVHKAAVKGAKC